MSLWFIIPTAIYVIGIIVMLLAIYSEAPKHESADIGAMHYVVAAVWPIWLGWYGYILLAEKFNARKRA